MGNQPVTEADSKAAAVNHKDGHANAIANGGPSTTADVVVSHVPTVTPATTSTSSAQDHAAGKVKKKLFERKKHFDFRELMPPQNLSQVNENEPLSLSRHQRSLIIEGWSEAVRPGSNGPGVWIFKKIFHRNPEIKLVFHLHKIQDSHLGESMRFQKHAQVFSNFLDIIVRSLEKQDDNLGPLLFYYGSKHVQLENNHPFKPEYWNDFGQSMVAFQKTWEQNKNSRETKQSWKILVQYVVKKMWEGFELEHERRIQKEHENIPVRRPIT